MKRPKNSSQRGQSLVLIALLMIAMIAFLGLVLDGGVVLASRRTSQDASDAAAFAGVRVLATRTDNSSATEQLIWNNITTFATANGVVTTTDIVATLIDQYGSDICKINQNCNGVPTSPYPTGVRVTTTLRMQPYFISVIIGKARIPVQAAAAAQSGNPSIGSELAPLSLKFPCPYPVPDPPPANCNPPFHYGDPPYQLFGDPQLAGGFQWVSYECASTANSVESYLRMTKTSGPILADKDDTYYNPLNPTDYNNMPPPSPWVCSGPGVQPNSQIQAALDCWLYPTGPNCWLPPTRYPGSNLWTVPVFDQTNGLTGSNAKYHTVMFAEFEFLGYWFGNNQYNFIGNTNPPLTPLPSQLQICADQNQKCIMGRFKREVKNFQIVPGKCNSSGVDVCGFGLSE